MGKLSEEDWNEMCAAADQDAFTVMRNLLNSFSEAYPHNDKPVTITQNQYDALRHVIAATLGTLSAVTRTHKERIEALETQSTAMGYRGVWKPSEAYARGSFVTCAGSLWHADRDVAGVEPGKGDAFTLAVKRGRDGKDARP